MRHLAERCCILLFPLNTVDCKTSHVRRGSSQDLVDFSRAVIESVPPDFTLAVPFSVSLAAPLGAFAEDAVDMAVHVCVWPEPHPILHCNRKGYPPIRYRNW